MITDFKQAMDEAKRIYDARESGWITVAYEIAHEMLCSVPPIYFHKGFACGEAYSSRNGKTTYYCFRNESEGAMECRICSIDEAQVQDTIIQAQVDNLLGTFIPMKQWDKAFATLDEIFQTLKVCTADRKPLVPPKTYVSIGNGGPVSYSLLSGIDGTATFIRYEFSKFSGQMEESHKYTLPEKR